FFLCFIFFCVGCVGVFLDCSFVLWGVGVVRGGVFVGVWGGVFLGFGAMRGGGGACSGVVLVLVALVFSVKFFIYLFFFLHRTPPP
ncbi:hypothetical protein ACNIQ0_24435, partial [Escherichia coli]